MSELITDGAYGTGLSTVTPDGTVLDVWYPSPALFSADAPFREQPELRLSERTDDIRGVQLRIVQGRIASLADAPVDTADAYLRLHLLSARLVRPRSINLDGIFGLLPNNAWTSLGPVPADDVERVRLEAVTAGIRLSVFGVDKFPRMTDYVVPSGVRIAHADRVRLGAHLAAGTKLTLKADGEEQVVKARELSGTAGLLYRRNSLTGGVEAVPRSGSWGGLNTALHTH